ncbi:TetR/AcrR family transcriptional regulator [Clostridioides difficile]|nr:TetR/AcrR family transcriptional regulator [Clostridioides difficile]
MRVSKKMVIQTASDIADKSGLNSVSLKIVADKLNIKTPSLYNHIESLTELLREVAHNGMRIMNERMVKVAVGKTGKEAIQLISIEYLNYMIEHPGIYETIQWAGWNGTEETATIFNNYLSLLTTLIQSCNLNKDKTLEILNMLTGIIHGYTTLQLRNAFSAPDKVRRELSEMIDTLLVGISQKYK